MKINIKIEDLIHNNIIESNRIEYKSGFNPNPIIRSICAFANDMDNIGGGYIIIGVEENNGVVKFPVKGVPENELDKIQKELFNYCHFIEPIYIPVIEPIKFDDKYLVVIYAYGGNNRPYKAPKEVTSKNKEKYRYIRKNSITAIPSYDDETELIEISKKIPFDDSPCYQANIADLDIGIIREYLKEVNSKLYFDSKDLSVNQLAENLNIVTHNSIPNIPLNVGILMFSEEPQKYFPHAYIEIVYKPSLDGQNMIEKKFIGPIQRQLRDALQYIKGFVISSKIIKIDDKPESVVYYNYPFQAIEEILSNAVYHKSYQIDVPITVMIYENHIEITSFPGFDRSIKLGDIDNHTINSKIYRNRRIGDFLKELKLIEGRNTGFPRIYKSLKENDSDDVMITMDEDRRFVTITININKLFINNTKNEISEYEQQIIDILRNKPLNVTDISKMLGNKSITKKVTRTLDEMCKKELIYKTFNNKFSISKIEINNGVITSTIKTDNAILEEGNAILNSKLTDTREKLLEKLDDIHKFVTKMRDCSNSQQLRDMSEVFVNDGTINFNSNNVIKMNYDYMLLLEKITNYERKIIKMLEDKYR